MHIFWFILYNTILYPLLFFCVSAFSLFSGKTRKSVYGKFGSIKILKSYFKQNRKNIDIYWFHASSLGEFYQIKPVLESLKTQKPRSRILMSFTSPSGYDNVHSDLIDLKFYMPFDFLWSVNRALDIVCPNKVIFASYDYWPNFLWISSLKGIYTKIFAYRFKQSTFKTFPVVSNFFKSIYRFVDVICTVSKEDERFFMLHFGLLNTPTLKVMGNPRYDMVQKAVKDCDHDMQPDDYIRIIIGSAHEEEEYILIKSLSKLMRSYPDIKIVYVPHEPKRDEIDRIKSKFKHEGFLTTVFNKKNDLALPNDQLVVVGIVGVLSRLYWQSSIAYIGGGFSTGIHNVMEPAVAGIPVLFGPRYDHAHEAGELLSVSGGFVVNNAAEFTEKMTELIEDSTQLQISGLAARDAIHKNSGSTEKIVESILNE